MRAFNLADLFELVANAVPDREVMVAGARRLSYRQLDERATRLARHLASQGVAPGDHVGLQMVNGTEYIEGMLAAFKLRAVPINVNFRYVEKELRYLFEDANLVALVYHRQFGPRVTVAADGLQKLQQFIVVEDGSGEAPVPGSVEYEAALEAQSGDPLDIERSADDHYIVYTGGTTGMPKGVVWRQEDIFFAALGGGDPMQLGSFITEPEQITERLPEAGLVFLAIPPFMHVSAHWGAFGVMFGGGRIVVPPEGTFDPETLWNLVGQERINMFVMVGDAMARPLLDALEAATAAGRPYDISSLFVIGTGGAMLSPSGKERVAALLPNVILVDGYGSSETGVVGTSTGTSRQFTVNTQTQVLDDDGHPITPGSGQVGRLARSGHVPLGYYGDEAKTAATFVVFDGTRYVLSGDMATVEEDGTVALLGRGSVSINTGGEKVYPEEVENVLKAHPGVADAVVVGVPDERWGERVVAVIQPVGDAIPELADLQALCREHMAGYKVPRDLCVVSQMVRSPAGKADYRWARDAALSAGTPPR